MPDRTASPSTETGDKTDAALVVVALDGGGAAPFEGGVKAPVTLASDLGAGLAAEDNKPVVVLVEPALDSLARMLAGHPVVQGGLAGWMHKLTAQIETLTQAGPRAVVFDRTGIAADPAAAEQAAKAALGIVLDVAAGQADAKSDAVPAAETGSDPALFRLLAADLLTRNGAARALADALGALIAGPRGIPPGIDDLAQDTRDALARLVEERDLLRVDIPLIQTQLEEAVLQARLLQAGQTAQQTAHRSQDRAQHNREAILVAAILSQGQQADAAHRHTAAHEAELEALQAELARIHAAQAS